MVLLVVEFFADKIPAINHANDAIQTFIRPVAGAILFAASVNVITAIHPVLAMILGLLVAGAVHTAKSVVVRPAVTATTGGMANPLVSAAEDVAAAGISIVAVVLPVLISALIVVFAAFVAWLFWRNLQRRARA